MGNSKRNAGVWIVNFVTYGTGVVQQSVDCFATKAKAEVEAKQLRACGHSHVECKFVSYDMATTK